MTEVTCDPIRLNAELIQARAYVIATQRMLPIHRRTVLHLRSVEKIGGLPLTPLVEDEPVEPASGGQELGCNLEELREELNGAVIALERARTRLRYRKNDLRLAQQLLVERADQQDAMSRAADSVSGNDIIAAELARAISRRTEAGEGLATATTELRDQQLEFNIRVMHLQGMQHIAGVPQISDGGIYADGSGGGGYR